jgi:hypothetical protein
VTFVVEIQGPFCFLIKVIAAFTVKGFYVLNRALLVQFAPPAAGGRGREKQTTNWGSATAEPELHRINH